MFYHYALRIHYLIYYYRADKFHQDHMFFLSPLQYSRILKISHMENSTPQTITTICVPNDANPEVVARSLFGITSLSGLFSSIHPLLIPAPCTTIAEFGNKSLLKLLLEQALVVLKPLRTAVLPSFITLPTTLYDVPRNLLFHLKIFQKVHQIQSLFYYRLLLLHQYYVYYHPDKILIICFPN